MFREAGEISTVSDLFCAVLASQAYRCPARAVPLPVHKEAPTLTLLGAICTLELSPALQSCLQTLGGKSPSVPTLPQLLPQEWLPHCSTAREGKAQIT